MFPPPVSFGALYILTHSEQVRVFFEGVSPFVSGKKVRIAVASMCERFVTVSVVEDRRFISPNSQTQIKEIRSEHHRE